MDSPAIPAIERTRRTRNGFLPPVVSTQAEKGIRSSDPEKEGAATSSPTSSGDSPRIPFRIFAVGPKRETAAKPTKKPRVAPASPWAGVPTIGNRSLASPFISSSTRFLTPLARVIPPVDRRGNNVVRADAEEEGNRRAVPCDHGSDQRCEDERTVRRNRRGPPDHSRALPGGMRKNDRILPERGGVADAGEQEDQQHQGDEVRELGERRRRQQFCERHHPHAEDQPDPGKVRQDSAADL